MALALGLAVWAGGGVPGENAASERGAACAVCLWYW